jgi:cardiolipin synthase
MTMQLILPKDYVLQATQLINKAKKRVSLISMVIADHENTHLLIQALIDAAKRGVQVSVAADIFTYSEVNGSFIGLRYYSPQSREATDMAKRLKSAGVHFHWLGHARMTVINGRTHDKWCVVDSHIFTFGGVNMYQQGIENVDYMFSLQDEKLADRLVKEQHRIQKAERTATNYPSTSFALNDDTVLFDGGIIAHSIIYKRACELTEQAVSVQFVSQYCPSGKLASLLKITQHTLYFNQPEQATIINRVLIRLNMLLTGFHSQYSRSTYLHAKCIVFTMKDGSKRAITGSHNFAYAGVLFGTREIALETKDPAVIRQLESFIAEHIA